MSLLEFKNVTAGYAGSVVLKDLSFSIDAGETVGLVGLNGAGKTTTLMSVYGLPSVDGEILIDGSHLGARRFEPAARGVSLVPQGRRILANLTVEENLLLGRASGRSQVWQLKDVYELFPNLGRRAGRPGMALSGGEQQMLAIGRGLMASPSLLMLDEPSEGLAPVVIDELVEALISVKESGTALLLVEQRVSVIQSVVDRYMALRQGMLVSEGGVEQLETPEVQALIAL